MLESHELRVREKLSRELGHKTNVTLTMWLAGRALPSLSHLPALACAIEVPFEDLLLPWLADHDPGNAQRYHLMAGQIIGPDAANDLFSGDRVNSSSPWLAMPCRPVSAAAMMADSEHAIPGMHRDWQM